MNRSHRLAAACGALLLVSVCGPALPAAHADEPAPKVLLMLDSSGSMKDADPSGGTKMDAAKKALIHALDSVPSNAEVGLRVYGADVDGNGAPGSCTDSRLAHPVGAMDKAGLTSAINQFQPRGDTPIAYALKEGAKDLGDSGKRHIILVSDGEETCSPDPCQEIRELIAGGVSLQIDTVGFGVGDKARQQLACMAEAGGGSYYDAKDAKSLDSSLQRLGARTARGFTVEGTPVQGADIPAGAPMLAPGQYTDVSVASSKKTEKYYKVRRSQPGSTLRVNVLTRMPNASTSDSLKRGSWIWALKTMNDDTCASESSSGFDSGKTGVVVGQTLVALPTDPRNPASKGTSDQACADAKEFYFKVERLPGSGGAIPIEIRVMEEAPVENAGQLPTGVQEVPSNNSEGAGSPATDNVTSVLGGASFNDALEVAPGTYSVELVPGEMAFFKTPIKYGQSGIFALDGLELSPGVIRDSGLTDHVAVSSAVYAPDFSRMDSASSDETMFFMRKTGAYSNNAPHINQVPEVRYRNRWDSPEMHHSSRGFAMEGYYYYAVALGNEAFLKGQPANVKFSLNVSGEATGPSGNVQVSEVPPGESSSTDSGQGNLFGDSTKLVLFGAGGALVVLGGGGVAYVLLRRRS